MKIVEVLFLISGVRTVEGFVLRSVGKTAYESAAYHEPNFGPEKALDGNLSTYIHTQSWLGYGSWAVDLETEVTSPVVKIYFRVTIKDRRNGVRISLYNHVENSSFCHEISGQPDGADIPDIYEIKCEGRGRYLNISTVTNNDGQGALLDFLEVEVYEMPACSGPIALKKHASLVLDETESIVMPAFNRNECAKECCFTNRLCPAFSFSPEHGQCKIATGVVRASAAPNWDTYGHFIVD